MFEKFIEERIKYPAFKNRILTADQAAQYVKDGMTVSIPEFGSYSNPMDICDAVTRRVRDGGEKIELFVIKCANAHTRLEADWSKYGIMKRRMIFMGESTVRQKVNTAGGIEFQDPHLGLVPDKLRHGVYGKIDLALVGCCGVTEDGKLLPAFDQGYTQVVLDCAEKVLLEINVNSLECLYKLHDVYSKKTFSEGREPIPMTDILDRIGEPYYHVDPDKVVGIVISDYAMDILPMWNVATMTPELEAAADSFVNFIKDEVAAGRLPEKLLPFQTGAGAMADAAFRKLGEHFKDLTLYTEGFMKGTFELLKEGIVTKISTGGMSVDAEFYDYIRDNIDELTKKIVIRPGEITNSAELISRFGVIALNNALEVDLYGNVNSTNALGTRMISGIGGSGDFARNAYLTVFFTYATAKNGTISSIVPMCSHIDHTEHDVDIIVTEYGIADLRNKSPRERAAEMIKVADPEYRVMLQDYYDRAVAQCGDGNCHTPHILSEALSWHDRYLKTGTMKLS